jgi:hypothetical protein
MRKLFLLGLLIVFYTNSSSQVLLSFGTGASALLPDEKNSIESDLGYHYKMFLGARIYERYDIGLEHVQTSILDDDNNQVSYLNFKGMMYISTLGKYEAHLKPTHLYYLNVGCGLYTHKQAGGGGSFDKSRRDNIGFNLGGGVRVKEYSFGLDFHSTGKFLEKGKGVRFVNMTISYNFELFRDKYKTITTRYDCY